MIRHKIHRPSVVRDLRHGQRFRFVPLEALLGLNPRVRFQCAVNPLDAFLVPAIALHVAQIQKTQVKGPVPLVSSQPLQPVGDLFVLITYHWAVAITRLADLERAAG